MEVSKELDPITDNIFGISNTFAFLAVNFKPTEDFFRAIKGMEEVYNFRHLPEFNGNRSNVFFSVRGFGLLDLPFNIELPFLKGVKETEDGIIGVIYQITGENLLQKVNVFSEEGSYGRRCAYLYLNDVDPPSYERTLHLLKLKYQRTEDGIG